MAHSQRPHQHPHAAERARRSLTENLTDFRARIMLAMDADLFEQSHLSILDVLLLIDELAQLVQTMNNQATGDGK